MTDQKLMGQLLLTPRKVLARILDDLEEATLSGEPEAVLDEINIYRRKLDLPQESQC